MKQNVDRDVLLAVIDKETNSYFNPPLLSEHALNDQVVALLGESRLRLGRSLHSSLPSFAFKLTFKSF